MATTTNYSWATPDDTDLVKDGAAAIRTLGSSADTTVKDLNPGTTAGDIDYYTSSTAKARIAIGTAGQVLKVNAGGTAPEWGTTADQTPLTTKGDLFTFDTADARLGVGANGTVLMADSAETTGLKWAVDPVADVVTTAGDLIYGTAADTVARLGIGTAGQVLQVNSGATAPEWATAAGGSANWSLLNAGGTALTGAATITVSGISAKDKVLILISDASSANATSEIRVQFNTDTGGNYNNVGATYNATTTYAVDNYSDTNLIGATYIPIGRMAGTATANVSGGLTLTGCNASGVKAFFSVGAGRGVFGQQNQTAYITQGVYTGSSTISSISVVSSTGNFDAGTVYVYTSA